MFISKTSIIFPKNKNSFLHDPNTIIKGIALTQSNSR